MSELIDKLDAYGANTKEAMARMLDDEGFYLECLNTFKDDEGFANLEKCVKSGDVDASFDQAHALKGVAGNLGLTPLFSALSTWWNPCAREIFPTETPWSPR